MTPAIVHQSLETVHILKTKLIEKIKTMKIVRFFSTINVNIPFHNFIFLILNVLAIFFLTL